MWKKASNQPNLWQLLFTYYQTAEFAAKIWDNRLISRLLSVESLQAAQS
jgi:hypothetical protein